MLMSHGQWSIGQYIVGSSAYDNELMNCMKKSYNAIIEHF